MTLPQDFRWEHQLSESFQHSAQPSLWTQCRSGTWIRAHESTCSEGRADVVWGRFEKGLSLNELRMHASLLQNSTASRILAMLRQEPEQEEASLLHRLGVTRPVLRKWLRALVEAGFIENRPDNTYRIVSAKRLPKVEICSFELKLKNWQRALYQATRYRSFSHRVFVVMPSSTAVIAYRHKDQFSKANVGLVAHDVHGTSKILVRPERRQPHATFRTIMAIGMLSASQLKG